MHHTAVSRWAEALLGRSLSQDELDKMPALLIRKVDHSGKKGSGAFHSILPAVPPPGMSEADMLLRLQQAYADFGRPQVWAVARQWLRTKGVQ